MAATATAYCGATDPAAERLLKDHLDLDRRIDWDFGKALGLTVSPSLLGDKMIE